MKLRRKYHESCYVGLGNKMGHKKRHIVIFMTVILLFHWIELVEVILLFHWICWDRNYSRISSLFRALMSRNNACAVFNYIPCWDFPQLQQANFDKANDGLQKNSTGGGSWKKANIFCVISSEWKYNGAFYRVTMKMTGAYTPFQIHLCLRSTTIIVLWEEKVRDWRQKLHTTMTMLQRTSFFTEFVCSKRCNRYLYCFKVVVKRIQT